MPSMRNEGGLLLPSQPQIVQSVHFRVGATTMVRNDLRGRRASLLEHIEYHRLLGFDRWYVYDNGGDDGTARVLGSYSSAVRVIS